MRALFALFSLLVAFSTPAAAQSYTVPIDQAGLLRLPEDAAAIVVGNPAIADATMFNARTVFISGRAYGQTNLIALNAHGQVIYANDISVNHTDREHVQVYHNIDQASFICNPVCRPVMVIGDAEDTFTATRNQRTGIREDADSATQRSLTGRD